MRAQYAFSLAQDACLRVWDLEKEALVGELQVPAQGKLPAHEESDEAVAYPSLAFPYVSICNFLIWLRSSFLHVSEFSCFSMR